MAHPSPHAGPVTEEMVWAAADRLRAEGGKPSVRNIQGELGGSNTTVMKYLKTWRARQAPAEAGHGALAPDIAKLIGEAIHREIAGARSELEEKLGECEAANDLLIQEADQRDQAIAGYEKEIERLGAELSQCQGRTEHAEQARQESEAELARERDNAQDAVARAARAEVEAAALKDAVTTLREERNTAQSAIRAAETRAADQERAAAVAAAEVAAFAREREVHEATVADLQRRLDTTQRALEDAQHAHAQVAGLTSEVSALTDRLAAQDERLARTEAALERARQRGDDLLLRKTDAPNAEPADE